MGAIRKDYGSYLLGAITCNNAEIYGGSQSSYQYIGLTYSTRSGQGKEDLINYNYSNQFTPTITNSYLGLLTAIPQYHMGTANNLLHPAIQVKNLETSSAYSLKNFLDVREIPNRSHNNLLDNTNPSGSHYWPEYTRVLLGKLYYNGNQNRYYAGETYMTGPKMQENYTVVDGQAIPNPLLVNKNSTGLFLGENTLTYDWPAIKHFGLFRRANDEGNLYIYQDMGDNRYYIEEQPDLYFWGELAVNNKWYHLSTDQTPGTGKVYYTRTGSTEATYVYTEWDGSTPFTPGSMYEKLGIIVHQDEGASFSPGAFQLIFEDGTFEG